MRNRYLLFAVAIVLTVWSPRNLYCQAVGNIVGFVVDPSDAIVPGAKVTAVQKGTQLTRTTLTSASGNYTLPLLPVGTYVITAQASGFQSSSVEVSLDVDQ